MSLSRIAFQVNTEDYKEASFRINALGNAIDNLSRKKKNPKVDQFKSYATRKLKNVVLELALSIARNAYTLTPIGDDAKIERGAKGVSGKDAMYYWLYEYRNEDLGLPMQAGYHAGAWRYSESRTPEFKPEIRDMEKMLSDLKADFKANFTLGETFFIGAAGPAYKLFETGVIGQPITKPTIDLVMMTYKIDLQQAYRNG
jgi:hypothetical protein